MSTRQNCPNELKYQVKGESPGSFFLTGNSNYGGHPNNMSILTPSTSNFPIPSTCFSCGGKFHKHGKRDRHVIKQGKVWYSVQRYCCPCGKTRTLLLDFMLPHKHYAAPEIEQVLMTQEDPTAPPHECGAEESTLRKWRLEFPPKLSALAAFFESVINISNISLVPPLQRLYNALASLAHPPLKHCRLAWAFFVSQSHPLHL